MQTETIEIVTSKERFFLEYLILKKPVIDSILTRMLRKKSSLRDMQMKVLAQLLYFNDMYRDKSEEDRSNILFSRETRFRISANLGIKEHHLNNYLSQLRAMKVIDGKKIRNIFVIYSGDIKELSFKFLLNGHK